MAVQPSAGCSYMLNCDYTLICLSEPLKVRIFPPIIFLSTFSEEE